MWLTRVATSKSLSLKQIRQISTEHNYNTNDGMEHVGVQNI